MRTYKRGKLKRKPSTPGEILDEVFLKGKDIKQVEFARSLAKLTNGRVKESTMQTKLSEVIKGKRAISAEFAILISQLLDTNPKMWLNLQSSLDLWIAEKELGIAS